MNRPIGNRSYVKVKFKAANSANDYEVRIPTTGDVAGDTNLALEFIADAALNSDPDVVGIGYKWEIREYDATTNQVVSQADDAIWLIRPTATQRQ